MTFQLNDDQITLLNSNELWNNKELITRQQQPAALLSSLSVLFMNTIAYLNLTKQDALDTISYILYEYNDLVHSQLFDCFLNNCLFKPIDSTFITLNYDQLPAISGIFMPLTKCYSPSCRPNNINCYSPLCSNKRISSLLHIVNTVQISSINNKISKDWIENIPQHIRDSTNRKELKRQAGIAELLLTEKNYCHDLDILHTIYAIPLLESTDIIHNSSRRQRFYNNVFGNYLDITHLHHSFYDKLKSHNRQSSYFVGRIGTIIMQHVTNLIEPYIQYAFHHTKAIHYMTIEYKNNPHFAQFLEAQNAQKCTRRLGLRHYLTSPTLWIGKFKLMIEAILKNTVDDADQLTLKTSITILHDTLCRMNHSATMNISSQDLRYEELSTSIYCADMQLLTLPESSTLIREEAIWLARSTHPLQPLLCHLFLFSHALILTHPRVTSTRTEYFILPGSPIPIQFLMIGNHASSMIRRLSFASTSMVSTPIYLLNNIRRQKSINSESSTNTTDSADSGYQSSSTGVKRIPSQIKTKLSKLKNNFKWSASVPVSPIDTTTVSVTRRDSAPALLYRRQSKVEAEEQIKKQQQRRTLKISHSAFPENAFKLEFLSRSDRLIWETLLKNVISTIEKDEKVFTMKQACKSLFKINTMSDTNVNMEVTGKITCSCAFVYTDGYSENLLVFGTLHGIWMGSRDTNTSFYPVLPDFDVQQLFILNNKLIVLYNGNKQNMLIAYGLKTMVDSYRSSQPFNVATMDWCMIKRSSVICFTVGKIRNQTVIAYLTRRAQTIWLVIIVPNDTISQPTFSRNHWFKKYRAEFKVSIKDPTSMQIMYDAVFVQSDRYGVERIDIYNEPSTILNVKTNWVFTGPNTGLISSGINGTVCDHNYAYSVSLFDQHQIPNALVKVKFEAPVNHAAIVFPYLIVFSSSVIEIRNIQTTELVQVLRGSRIKFVSTTNDHTQPLFFTMANVNDPRLTSVYQLQLAL